MKKNELDVFINTQEQIKKACLLFGKCYRSKNYYNIISHPKRLLEVNIPFTG